jgi:hypothetical protein
MDLQSVYSNSCGVKNPASPVLPYSKWFPIPKKYITIQTSSGMQSKNYDYYDLVLEMIQPRLRTLGIEIAQIGGKDDIRMAGAKHYLGGTDLAQATYVVKNALLHVGNDSCWVHVAGEFGVPVVALYGPTYAAVCGPHYKNPNSILIESDRDGKKPTHQVEENPKTINLIEPEDVANAILKILNQEKVNEHTVFIGEAYHKVTHHIVPNHFPDLAGFLPGGVLVRLDYLFNENGAGQILSQLEGGLVTNKPIHPDLSKLAKFVEYEISSVAECDLGFVKHLDATKKIIDQDGIKPQYALTTRLDGKEFADLKLKLFDFGKVFQKKPIENLPVEGYKKVNVKSKSFVFSGGKRFLSRWHLDQGFEFDGTTEITKNQAFLEYLNNFYLYEIK